VNERSSITAPMKLRKSRTSPWRIVRIIATTRSFTSGQSDFGTYSAARRRALLPLVLERAADDADGQRLGSADGWARMKSLPPVSPTMRG
jgi:hypothetical protein